MNCRPRVAGRMSGNVAADDESEDETASYEHFYPGSHSG